MTALLSGLGLCLALIVAPGAQNVYLLRMGMKRQHVFTLALVCFLSDIALISIGVAGIGTVITTAPWLLEAFRWVGVVFLSGYALTAAWRALRPTGETLVPLTTTESVSTRASRADAPGSGQTVEVMSGTATATITRVSAPKTSHKRTLLPAILTILALTWLNPHAYLDTVVLLGSVSTSFDDNRWIFAIGAIIGSGIWFVFLSFASRAASRWLRSPRSWRVLDAVIAVVMATLAVGLAVA